MSRSFAAFDIDGTLIRWQLFHAVVDELGKRGQVPDVEYQKIRGARRLWKQRSQAGDFRQYEQLLVDTYQAAVAGMAVKNFQAAVEKVFDEYKDQVYAYTRDLIRDLKAKNYLLFAVSGSQTEVVKLLADYYGFDDYAGSEYSQKDGKFTGEHQTLRHERKIAALNNMIKKFDATKQGSIAVGDSEGDIPMLEQAETAIAFNPTKDLFDHARSKGWKIVVERKNMIYELEASNGTYRLL